MRHFLHRWRPLAALAMLSLGGCVSTNFEQVREGQTGIEDDESIVILGQRNSLGYEARASLINCLGNSTKKINVIKQTDFVDAMFPWFEPRLAPQTIEELTALLKQPAVADRMRQMNVRYLAWANGVSSVDERKGSMACGASPGVAFCLGFILWIENASYQVAIWDIKQAIVAGRMRADATATSAILGAIAPIPLIASTERNSCKIIAKQLSNFIREPS